MDSGTNVCIAKEKKDSGIPAVILQKPMQVQRQLGVVHDGAMLAAGGWRLAAGGCNIQAVERGPRRRFRFRERQERLCNSTDTGKGSIANPSHPTPTPTPTATQPSPATVHRRRAVAATPPEVFEFWKLSAPSSSSGFDAIFPTVAGLNFVNLSPTR